MTRKAGVKHLDQRQYVEHDNSVFKSGNWIELSSPHDPTALQQKFSDTVQLWYV